MKKLTLAILSVVALMAFSCVSSATELDYPKSPITIVVPYGAGGAMDITARLFAKYAEKLCGQPIVVTNLPGGSGSVGAMDILKSRSDGYKAFIFDPGPGFVSTKVNRIPFNTIKDFSIVARQTSDTRVIAIRVGDERYSNVQQFLDYVRKHPGEVNVATPGIRSDGAIALELLKCIGGLDMVNMPCSGASEAKSNLLGGHVDAAGLSVSDCLSLVADKKIIVVAIYGEERNSMMPDVQTFKELGINCVWKTSRGYAFKAGTDARIVAYFDDLVRKVSQDPAYIAELKKLGCPVDYLGREEYAKYIAANLQTIADIMNK